MEYAVRRQCIGRVKVLTPRFTSGANDVRASLLRMRNGGSLVHVSRWMHIGHISCRTEIVSQSTSWKLEDHILP